MIDWKRIGAVCGILGGLLFVIITFADMLIYPGGYSFLDNYFSQLGLTVINGQPALLNYMLFSLACSSAAICSIPFWLAIRTEFTKTSALKDVGYVGTFLGVVAAPFLSALALLAADIFPLQHGLSTEIFFMLYASAIIIYSVGMLVNKDYNNVLSIVGFVVAAICFLLIFFIPTALMQKIAVYSLVLWSAFQGYYLLRAMKQ